MTEKAAETVTERALSRFPVPALRTLPEDLRTRIETVNEKLGFVPNVFLVLAHRPAELRAFLAYHDALMESDEGLTRAEREMIVVATSSANQCLYCTVSHGAFLRIRSKRAELGEQIAFNYREADISLRQRTMLDYALKLAQSPWLVEDGDLDGLREAGFSDDEIWDIGAITALFAMSNRLASHTGMGPNRQFYGLAR
ncbi:putative peroxidase-related enzyme [Natronocella acetinitrilica]|uniref:Peroxidase-related enzyme n=1 Tax=Natronocella acetinitrilica TaxID=414046 RepID=A0AAE3KAR5_9GAMM|nr:peroxidase-related enzyme [Natronocella acetinitrilica]MCP1674690.1 putative peroxidase-related enzyme [Natronocella acetinitrilica]